MPNNQPMNHMVNKGMNMGYRMPVNVPNNVRMNNYPPGGNRPPGSFQGTENLNLINLSLIIVT